MSTDTPILPATAAEVNHYQGVAAEQRKALREEQLTRDELQGLNKSATLLNLSPFTLTLPTGGLIQWEIPPCPSGKDFSVFTLHARNTLWYPIYRGNEQMSDQSLRSRFDGKTVSPIEQLMEFKRAYYQDGGMDGLRQGGMVLFEGLPDKLDPRRLVRVPDWIYRKKNRYLTFSEHPLGELIEEGRQQLKDHCLAVIAQCDVWKDEGGMSAKNIQGRHRAIAKFALGMKWIDKAPLWVNARVEAADQCPRCGDQYRSRTGVCKCGYVVHPLQAYLSSEIKVDHVRMDALTKEDWAKVKAEEKRRIEAKA